jgi:hypothetical protein
MNDLFIQPVEFEKVSYKRVSENPAEWTGNVMEAFYSQFPFFANSPVTVTLTDKDESRGYAIGAIKITEGEGMVVPIVIQSRELFPFDVCIVKGTIMPLTNTTLNLYVQSRGAFLRVVKPDAGDPTNALFNTSFSQTITPTYISDQYKTADVHVPATDAVGKKVSDGAPCEKCKKVVCECSPSENAKVQVPASDAMGKKAQVDKDAEDFAKIGRMTLKDLDVNDPKKGKNGFTVTDAKGRPMLQFTPATKKASVIDKIAGTITQHMKDSFFAELDKNASIAEGFKRNNTQEPIQKLAAIAPSVVDFNDRVRKELDRDIHYIYKAGSHEYRGIFGNSHVVDPVEITIDAIAAAKLESIKTPAAAMEKQAESVNVIAYIPTPESMLAVFNGYDFTEIPPQHVSALGMEKKAMHVERLNAVEPEITKCAVWTVMTTNPFEITRVWTDGTRERIETWDGLDKISYIRMQGIDAPYTENGFTYLPKDAQIIKLGKRVMVNERMLPDPTLTDEVLCVDKNAYVLKGDTFAQYLHTDSKQYDMHKTAWHTLQCGGTKEDIEKIAQLTPGNIYHFEHHLNVPLSFDKVAQKMKNEYDVQVQRIHKGLLGKEWTKLASVITDTPTVDAVLSLNFVNRDNIIEFAQALPLFTDVSQKLADMLLKTRVGVRLVDENVLRRVMLGMVDVIDVLSGVANLAGRK